MGFDQGKCAIARIYSNSTDSVIGTGFLVAERYVLTCAHVIEAARLGSDIREIKLDFPYLKTLPPYYTELGWQQYDKRTPGDDFALLRLPASISKEDVEPIQIESKTLSLGCQLSALGFPRGDTTGRFLFAVNRGELPIGWVQIEDTKAQGLAIEPGFSGAPVWNEDTQSCVGMIVARDRKRSDAKIGFMFSAVRLVRSPLRCLTNLTLQDILRSELGNWRDKQIQEAYRTCRPVGWDQPLQKSITKILEDLVDMPDGPAEQPKLLQFVACLLNQVPNIPLQAWAEEQTPTLTELRQHMTAINLERKASASARPSLQASLLVQLQGLKSKPGFYDIKGWFIPNIEKYNSETGEGIDDQITYDGELDLAEGIALKDIPAVLANYMAQIGNRGDIDLKRVVVEFFLPISMMNEPVDQWLIEDDFGFKQTLAEECQVVMRSIERTRSKRYKARGMWEKKWWQLRQNLQADACQAFVTWEADLASLRQRLSRDTALGLKLGKCPSCEKGGELALLLATGTPMAVWIRHDCPDQLVDWCPLLDKQVLCCSLGQLLAQVAGVRQEQTAPDSTDEILPIGEYLTFVWEDPQRLPPSIVYSSASL
ncbi:trypsin-like peptidase domain-containing protein [Leptothoe sp. LEGE 181152]|nr:trypsin-like peptidase domain-containing protein [Leptothoe sp. LEGE 181152]